MIKYRKFSDLRQVLNEQGMTFEMTAFFQESKNKPLIHLWIGEQGVYL